MGMGCHFLLQGIFPAQGLNPHLLQLLEYRQILYQLSHQGSPILVSIRWWKEINADTGSVTGAVLGSLGRWQFITVLTNRRESPAYFPGWALACAKALGQAGDGWEGNTARRPRWLLMTEPGEMEGDGVRERAVRGLWGLPASVKTVDSILSDAGAAEGPGHGLPWPKLEGRHWLPCGGGPAGHPGWERRFGKRNL